MCMRPLVHKGNQHLRAVGRSMQHGKFFSAQKRAERRRGSRGESGAATYSCPPLVNGKNHVMSPVKNLGFFISNLKDIMKRVKHE